MPRSRRCPGGGNGINLVWRIPWTEEPGRLQSMRSGSQDQTRFINWVHTHIYNKSEECLLKKEHWWCLQNTGSVVSDRGWGGGCYSAAETPEAEALLQVQNYLKLCTQAPYQRFFKAIVIDECQLIWKKEHLWHHVGHATRADKRPGKMC